MNNQIQKNKYYKGKNIYIILHLKISVSGLNSRLVIAGERSKELEDKKGEVAKIAALRYKQMYKRCK